MVLVPYLQYDSAVQGALLNSADLYPLFDNQGAEAALALFAELMRYHGPLRAAGSECGTGVGAALEDWLTGQCALAFGWGQIFKVRLLAAWV